MTAGGASRYPAGSALGAIIRKQRELAALPMRQLAAAAGISNPYLSQIERGLRAPSETVMNAIADSLETTVDALYAEAGFLPPSDVAGDDGAALAQAIAEAAELTPAQRRALAEVYQAFVDANAARRYRASRPAGPA
jgi:transcriptional regulator with XRE-family HTH domain